MNNISKMAYVDPEARLGDNITIDAFAFIDKDVVIGDNCHVRPHVTILRGSRIGNNNTIYDGAVIGAEPQDFRWKGEHSLCVIGNDNHIHEHVIINRSIYAGKRTEVGNHSWIMAQSHIGHDSFIGDHCVIGNAVKIAGACSVADFAILSSGVILHEKSRVGKWTLIKGGCRISGNVPPYVIMAHNPVDYFGVNAFVLRKGNFRESIIDDIAKCYRHIYQCGTSVFNAVQRIKEDIHPSPERDEILQFIDQADNMIVATNRQDID